MVTYSKELGEEICNAIASSNKGLKRLCADNPTWPSHTAIFNWLKDENKKDFAVLYSRAKEIQAENIFDEIIDISDHSDEDHTPYTGMNVVQRDRLRIDARKWIVAKLLPKKYGDKIDVTSDGKSIQIPIIQVSDSKTADELNKFMAE